MNEYVCQIQVPLGYDSFGDHQTNDADDCLIVLIMKSSCKIKLELGKNHALVLDILSAA